MSNMNDWNKFFRYLIIIFLLITPSTWAMDTFFARTSLEYIYINTRTHLGYDTSISAADETSFELKGPGIGVSAGMDIYDGVSLTADLKYASLSGEGQGINNEDANIKRKMTMNTLFLSLIYRTQHFWYWLGSGAYGKFSDKGDYDDGTQYKLKTGKSYKLGLGFLLSPSVIVSLEYEYIKAKRDKEGDWNPSGYAWGYIQNYQPGDTTLISATLGLGLLF